MTIIPNAINVGVTVYNVRSAGKFCEAAATLTPPKCALKDLSAAREYTVEVKACASDTKCGPAKSKKAWTLPNRMILYTLY